MRFDILCILLALFDMGVTYLGPLTSEDGAGADTGAMGSLKMLKLARLGRIIRLLKFKIFQVPYKKEASTRRHE